MRASEFIIESITYDAGNSITLANLYDGDYPDRDETFWDYVSYNDFDTPLEIQTLPKHKVMIILLSQYRAEHIDEITDRLDGDQQEIIQSYMNDPAISNKVIVLSGHRIIDGNHRALAAALKGVPIKYVDLADLENVTVDEAEMGTPTSNEIKNTLVKAGYTMLGDGADSTVWTKDQGTVIKIIMPEEGEQITKAAETFYKFYEFCQQHKNLSCLPRFIDIGGQHHNTFEIQGKEYLQIAMERLSPIGDNTFEEGVVWFFSDFVVGGASWDQSDHALGMPDTWEEYNPKMAKTLAYYWQNLSMIDTNTQKYKELQTLYVVMQMLYKTGSINKFGWDLHTENAMMRNNGEIVIIDPWFNMEYGSR